MSLFRDLQQAKNEKDIENVFRSDLLKAIKDSTITSPHKTDGVLEKELGEGNRLKTLLEFKFNRNLKSKLEQTEVLIQCLFYLKQFQMAGEQLPSTIFVGDFDECFVLHVNDIAVYLTEKINWNIAPSEAASKNPSLVSKIITDNNVNPFVFDINDRFAIKDVIEKLTSLTKNIVRLVLVTRYNVQGLFDYFIRNILDSKTSLTPNQKAHIFIDLLINSNENFIHPKKANTLITKLVGEIRVNGGVFQSLFRHIKSEYTIREKEELVANVDMLVEMQTRRFKGEFFTPDLVALKADEYLQGVFGDNYKDEYVVWDCACGTLNLTKNHQYKELYASTLEQCDIDTANQMGINPESTKFQFDFLNSELKDLPKQLLNVLRTNRKILFFINPPFGTANNRDNIGSDDTSAKTGMAETVMGNKMKKDGWGASSRQLYAQFLFRINEIKIEFGLSDVSIGLFSKELFLSGSTFKGFRKNFLSNFSHQKAFLVNASIFTDTADSWGVMFSVWKSGVSQNKNSFLTDILVPEQNLSELAISGQKYVYNLDDQEKDIRDWLKDTSENSKVLFPHMNNALSVTEKTHQRLLKGSLGTACLLNNNVYENNQGVYVVCGIATRGNASIALSITPNNILNVFSLFTARRLITGSYANWLNDKSEYTIPNNQHQQWNGYLMDALVYGLFNNSSLQSSMRQVQYEKQSWNIKNEFFWLSRKEMMELAEKNYFDELYQDARFDKDRYVYSLLFGDPKIYDQLSPDAKQVIDAASELVKKSFAMRKILHQEHPEWHLQAWDAGWYQAKLVLKEYFKDDLTEFSKLYKQFENRMRPLVYELGFLRK